MIVLKEDSIPTIWKEALALMKIGHFLNVLALNSELLADKVEELGIRGFINYFKLACNGSLLDKNRIKEARERKFM